MTKTVLKLNQGEAFDFFMKPEQYHTFELPEYFKLNQILDHVRDIIKDAPLDDCMSDKSPESCKDINMNILLNKDGRYAVRPLTMANPYLYYFLVRCICDKQGWDMTRECFKSYTVPHITSCAIPVIPDKDRKEKFHNSTIILNWWNVFEQKSLELSLTYRYMFMTDITNCYGSFLPESIGMALNRKGTKFETDKYIDKADAICRLLRALQQGRNIGIPQGSTTFDFLGEFILGYSDLLLHEELQRRKITGYEILRYRDDYRVFCNDKGKLEEISYIIQHILESLNLRLNSRKTKISDSIVTDSIKPDKLYYIENTPITNKNGCDFDSVEKHLLYILLFGRKYNDAGQLKNMLSKLDDRVQEMLNPHEVEREIEVVDLENDGEVTKATEVVVVDGYIPGNIAAIAAVGVQIALENINATQYVLRVVSRIVDSVKSERLKWSIFDRIYEKLKGMPNSEYNQIWLQNMTYQRDKKAHKNPYNVRLCRLAMGEDVEIWDNSWLKPEYTKDLPISSICDYELMSTLTPVITFRETRAYFDM